MPGTPDKPITPPDSPSHDEPPVQDPRTPAPHPIDPPVNPPQVAGTDKAPAAKESHAGDEQPGKVPPQPEGNRIMPSDNPETGLDSYMDE